MTSLVDPDDRARAEFEEFYRRRHRELGRLAYALTGDRADADEITGEALASAWQAWARVRAMDHPVAYVRKIVVNLSALRIRKAVKERQGLFLLGQMTSWFELGPDVGGAVDLQAAVLRLPPRRRACVVMRHVLDLPEHEVAAALGINVGTVKSQTSKGLGQLRRMMADRNGSGEANHGD